MKVTLAKLLAFFALTGFTLAALAQEQHSPADQTQHHIQHLTRVLSLTSAQQQQASTIFADMMASGGSLHGQMRAAHESLKAAVQKNDVAAIEQASNTIGGLTAQMTAAHAKAMAAFNQTLTPEQQAKFSQLQERQGPDFEHHGFRGHGGPNGPQSGSKE